MALAFCSFANYILGQKEPLLGRQGWVCILNLGKTNLLDYLHSKNDSFSIQLKRLYAHSFPLFSISDLLSALLNLYRLVRYLIMICTYHIYGPYMHNKKPHT